VSRRRSIHLSAIDRTRLRWREGDLDRELLALWQTRGKAKVLPLTVRSLREIAACQRRWDRRGWTVRAQTQLKSNTIAVFVHLRHRGARGYSRRARLLH